MPKVKKIRLTGFTRIDNNIINDDRMHLKALGLYTYMWSKPDDWQFYIEAIAKDFKDGKAAISTAIHELMDLGYLQRVQNRKDGKFGSYDYVLLETPKPENRTSVTENRFSEIGKSGAGKTEIVKSNTTNKDNTKTNSTKKESTKKDDDEDDELNQIYLNYFGGSKISPFVAGQLAALTKLYARPMVKQALGVAAENEASNPLGYARRVLQGWLASQIMTADQAKESRGIPLADRPPIPDLNF